MRAVANERKGKWQADQITLIWATSFEAPVVGVQSLPSASAFLLGDGTIRFEANGGGASIAKPHEGAILSYAYSTFHNAILTGGSDGRVMMSRMDSRPEEIARHTGKWIDCVASGTSAIGWSAGKSAYYLPHIGALRCIEVPSTPSGLAFDPKGRRLAISHYGGASLWLPKEDENLVRRLNWKGSHLGVNWSPDGKIVITMTQECALHGWRLSDGAEMQMSGYPGKIHSISWNRAGTRLATSGAPTAILWPFDNGGPWNRKPDEIGFMSTGISRVLWHPSADILAIGSASGGVDVVRCSDASLKMVREPGAGAVTGLAWIKQSKALAIGSERGRAEIHSLSEH